MEKNKVPIPEYKNPDLVKKYMHEFLKMLNIHRRLGVPAAVDIATGSYPELTMGDFDKVLEYLVEKNLVSFSRQCELFYLGDPPEMDSKQQPLPADMIENMMKQLNKQSQEIDRLKKDILSEKTSKK